MTDPKSETELLAEMFSQLQGQLDANLRKDSIEIGAPSKGGAVKVYLDVGNIKDSMERIDNAKSLLQYAREKFAGAPQ